MTRHVAPTIRIAAALIDDGEGHILLVRKAGSHCFMLPGGKIEPGESPAAALIRELREELGLAIDESAPRLLGRFRATAANEPGHIVEGDIHHLRLARFAAAPGAEIAEARWVTPEAARDLPLANLLRDHALPLFARLAR
ncbi:NUDIX hydrolase [Stakelama tenebrarum]|uniref:NUDIX domain-containing protein n=1 Tax=Stakelama tenebrarum TaxID=2711215 RepID=A0A6G6Y0I7_9SPHN|nr:NUDIX domain-containing protein [Sphingosinithalassobacter tenebrarum]QIG78351.1 NUDIX domain-containing protein [Sphingosinithalassobacter tenebrarum]